MWVCQKHLDFSSLPSSSSVSYLTMPILGAFLKRCGRNLHSLDLSHKPHELNSGVLQTIGKFKFVQISLFLRLTLHDLVEMAIA
jgi:hypothetical protein